MEYSETVLAFISGHKLSVDNPGTLSLFSEHITVKYAHNVANDVRFNRLACRLKFDSL